MEPAPETQLSYGGLWKAWVAIDGKPVEVYKVEEKPTIKKTTCFIEARDGAAFTVHTRDDQIYLTNDWAQWLEVDGKPMKGQSIANDLWLGPGRPINFTGRPDSERSEQPFVFSKPVVTDDADVACKDEKVVKNLGTIQVQLFRVTSGAYVQSTFAPTTPTVVHERAKKATLSHQAKLGASQAVPAIATRAVTYLDPRDSPYWTFEFRYLSRDLLEIQNIVESEPQVAASVSPPPEADSNAAKKGKKRQATTITLSSDDDSAGEDSKEELKRLRARIAKLEGVKEEGSTKKKVKKEKGGSSVIVIDD